MTTITLEHIEAKQSELAKLIALLKAEQPRTITIAEAPIELSKGEHYAGIILNADGLPSHHVVLLPGAAEDTTWSDAQDWAAEQGGVLPTRQEQALLYANLKNQFQAAAYWSGEQHEKESGWAWFQTFDDGGQYYDGKGAELRARAVRRLIIE